MSTPPPPRYRIVERGRRLVVIDSWDKGRPDAGEVVPRRASVTGSATNRPTAATGLGGLLVRLACLGADDGAGHRILATHEYYDASGPRDILLSAAAERRLGRMLARGALVLAIALVASWFFPLLLFVLAVGASGINKTARPAITRWLDGLEKQSMG